MRSKQWRAKTPGVELTEEEKADTRKRTLAFLQSKAESSKATPAAKAKALKALPKLERKATYEWILALHNSLCAGLGYGLERFLSKEPHREFDEDLQEGEASFEPMITMVMDQLQKQWSGAYYLQRALRLNIEVIIPPFHRRHNDLMAGVTKAGMYPVIVMAIFKHNIAYGPFGKGGNMTELRELGHELLATIDADHPLLVRLWPLIVRDRGWRMEEETNREARVRFCQVLGTLKPFTVKGEKASAARWMSVYRRIREAQPDYHIKLLGFAVLAMERKWVSHFEDLAAAKLPSLAGESMQVVANGAGDGGGRASASSSVATPAPQPKRVATRTVAKVAAQQAARSELSQLTQKSANNFHAAARLQADPDGYTLEVLLELVMRAWEKEHSRTSEQFKTVQGIVDYYVQMWRGDYHAAVWDCVGALSNLEELGRAGLTVDFTCSLKASLKENDASVVAEDCLAKSAWRLACNVISERCFSMSMHCGSYPLGLAGLLDAASAEQCMSEFKERWDAYAAARACSLPLVVRLAKRCPLNTRVMEQFARLARSTQYTPSWVVQDMVRRMFAGFGQEKIVEDLNQRQVDAQTRDSTSQSLGVWRSWQVAADCRLVEQYGRSPVQVEVAESIALRESYDDIFRPSSAADEAQSHLDLAGVMRDKEWTSLNSGGLRGLVSEMQVLVQAHALGDFAMVGEAWRCQVFPLHELVLIEAAGKITEVFLVLAKTDFAVLTYPVRRVGHRNIALAGHGSKSKLQSFFSFDGAFVVPVAPISPMHGLLRDGVAAGDYGIIGALGEKQPLLDFQARRGFLGVPESALRRLYRHLDLAEPSAVEDVDIETALALPLMQSLAQDMTAEQIEEALLARANDETYLAEKLLACVEVDSMLDDIVTIGDKPAMRDFCKMSKEHKVQRSKMAPLVKAFVEKAVCGGKRRPAVHVAASRAKVHTPKGAERWWATVRGDDSFIREWLPPGCSVTNDPWNGRFLLCRAGRRRSISWTVRGQEAASLEVLRTAWSWHSEFSSDPCPLPF